MTNMFMYLLVLCSVATCSVHGGKLFENVCGKNQTLAFSTSSTVVARSKTSCAVECSKRQCCASFRFEKKTGACSLSNMTLRECSTTAAANGVSVYLQVRKTSCPAEWMLFDNSCYYFSVTPKTRVDANAECQDLGGHLVSIQSEFEFDFVTKSAMAAEGVSDPSQAGGWWTGGWRHANESNWHLNQNWFWDGEDPDNECADLGDTLENYHPWMVNQPINYGSNEYFINFKYSQGKWGLNDAGDSENNFQWVCEY